MDFLIPVKLGFPPEKSSYYSQYITTTTSVKVLYIIYNATLLL